MLFYTRKEGKAGDVYPGPVHVYAPVAALSKRDTEKAAALDDSDALDDALRVPSHSDKAGKSTPLREKKRSGDGSDEASAAALSLSLEG